MTQLWFFNSSGDWIQVLMLLTLILLSLD
jgi:hypothetical protein